MRPFQLTGVLVMLVPFLGFWPAPASGAQTVVSLTWDDGFKDQLDGVELMDRYGMKGTFFVNSGFVGGPAYMALSDLRRLQAEGHEIGGHTLDHAHLKELSSTEQRRQICGDRAALQGWGFPAVSFAYPFGGYIETTISIVESCGYASARAAWGIDCEGPSCSAMNALPLQNRFTIRTPEAVNSATTVNMLKGYVIAAERAGGGWVPIQFHDVCSGPACRPYSISKQQLGQFLEWLSARAVTGTVVRTVRDVVSASSPAAPVLTGLSPEEIVAGSSNTVVRVSGSGFTTASRVFWKTTPLSTVFVSPTALDATVSSTLLAQPGSGTIAVVDPAAGTSNVMALHVTAPLEIRRVTPSRLTAGAGEVTLVIEGAGFRDGSQAQWNGAARPTTFVSATRLAVRLQAEDVAKAADASLTVLDRGGARSNGFLVTIAEAPVPPPPAQPATDPPQNPLNVDHSTPLRIYPNPWRPGLGVSSVILDGLPLGACVRVFSVSGHFVRRLVSTGAQAIWDLRNEAGQPVASGYYIFLTTDEEGRRVRGRVALLR